MRFLIVAGLFTFVTVVWAITSLISVEAEAYQEGRRAYNLGVQADANPYRGFGYTVAARRWLDGYLDAKEQFQKTEPFHP